MADRGYVKYYRSTMKSIVWSDPYLLKMFNYCLFKARHTSGKEVFGGHEIFLNSGQFVTGRDALGDAYNHGAKKRHQISSVSAFRLLKKLEELEILNIKSNTKYSVVTVINWGKYQNSEQQTDNKPTSSRQQTDTNKNVKNVKKGTSSKLRAYDDDTFEKKAAILLSNLMTQNNASRNKSENLDKWADEVRLMKERDNRTEKQIIWLINWSQQSEFWSTNILSMKKFRQQFDKMVVQARREHGQVPQTDAFTSDTNKQKFLQQQIRDYPDDPETVMTNLKLQHISMTRKEVDAAYAERNV